jgi:cytochrome c-type biogenesis protein CcmF
MIPELGHFALILALCLSLVLGIVPIAGAQLRKQAWIATARPTAIGLLVFMLLAYACLTYAFLVHDFSVLYVANTSNTKLPLLYLISGVWGAHEGSLLLWATVLAIWIGAVTVFSRSIPAVIIARVLGVMGLIMVGFLTFMIFTSNPFERVFPVPLEGRDLNPLLQDPGLAIHPPMLYMGYVGFVVAFAFAIAALLGGRLDSAWARWSRPWTNLAWMFLTLGITLGSWWAYYELGWGGWWFWDPVENASFMPWLVGTALMHSLAVAEKRSTFKAWTVLLAIFTFSLSLLGTFLVRSGVLTSVHAFATDPTRGVYILVFLAIVIGGSLFLYAWRAPQVRSSGTFKLVSRETALLLNNVFLVVVAAFILLGTLYPLILDALTGDKISVGPPYFDLIFVILTAPLAVLVAYGASARWKQDDFKSLTQRLRIPMIISIVFGVAYIVIFMPWNSVAAIIGMILATWVMSSTIQSFYQRIKGKPSVGRALLSTPRGFYGMHLAHFGIGVFIVGITLTSIYSTEKDLRMTPNQSHELGGYTFRFDGVHSVMGPNYRAQQGTLTVTQDGKQVAVLHPQKRIYLVQQNPMTEAAIDAGLTRDLFVALGDQLNDQGAWTVRLYHKPFIRWIWLGALLMALGGLVAATDRRYLLTARKSVTAKSNMAQAGAH